MKVFIGSDHGGYELKKKIINFLKRLKYIVEDLGTYAKGSCDYPLIGFKVAQEVSKDLDDNRGILICRSGIGMSIIANKVSGIRAGACYDKAMARSSRQHNDCNILVLAADYIKFKCAKEIVKIWLETEHEGGRHGRRVSQIKNIESTLRRDKSRSR